MIKNTVATKAAKGAQTELNVAMAVNPILAVVSAVLALTAAFASFNAMAGKSTNETKKLRVETENYIKAIDDARKSTQDRIAGTDAEAKYINELVGEYDKLRNSASLTEAEKIRLNTVAEELAKTLGKTTQELQTKDGAYKSLTADVDQYIKKLKEQALWESHKEEYTAAVKVQEEAQKKFDEAKAAWEEWLEKQDNPFKYKDEFSKDDWIAYAAGIGEPFEKQVKRAGILYSDYLGKLNAANKAVAKAEAALKSYSGTLSGTADGVETLSTKIAESKEKFAELSKEEETLQKQSTSLRSEMNSLANSLKSLENGEALSYNTLLDLIDKYPEYAGELAAAAGNADLQKIALEKLFEAKKQDYILTQQAAIDNIRASNEETKTIIDNAKKQMIARSKALAPNSKWNRDIEEFVDRQFSAEWSKIRENEKLIDDYMAKINLVSGLKIGDFVSSGGTSVSNSGKNSGSSSGAKNTENALYERQKLALAAYNKLVDNKIDKLKAEADAAKKSADAQIAAIDAVMKKRNEEKEDDKRQKEIAAIDAKLRYKQLTDFERDELERRKQDVLNEQLEANYQRQMNNLKSSAAAVQNRTNAAIDRLNASKSYLSDHVAYLQGSQSYDQRVKNNSNTVNVQIVQNGLNVQQLANTVVSQVLKELGGG